MRFNCRQKNWEPPLIGDSQFVWICFSRIVPAECGCRKRGGLVAEHQTVAKLVDDDRLLARHLVGQQTARQVVEDVVLDGTLHRTGTHIGVVALEPAS